MSKNELEKENERLREENERLHKEKEELEKKVKDLEIQLAFFQTLIYRLRSFILVVFKDRWY